jgi:hypothetical protein
MIIIGVRARVRWDMKLARMRYVMLKEYLWSIDPRRRHTNAIIVGIGI